MAESTDERPLEVLEAEPAEVNGSAPAEASPSSDHRDAVAVDGGELVEQDIDDGKESDIPQEQAVTVEEEAGDDEEDEKLEELDVEEVELSPPAIPSKDNAGAAAAAEQVGEARTSAEDPAAFQDVSLAEAAQQQRPLPREEEVTVQPNPTSHASSSSPPTPPRSRSGTASSSTLNGGSPASQSASANANTNAQQPVRPSVTSVRSSRASSTYSSRTASTSAANRKPLLQGVLVVSAFETILNSKDARRTPALKDAAQKALDILKAPSSQTSSVHTGEDRRREVLEPLRLACETRTNTIMITALDAIGKLVSYGFFNPPGNDSESIAEEEDASEDATLGGPSLPLSSSSTDNVTMPDEQTRQLSDLVVDTICDCFIESPQNAAAAALQAASNNGPDAVNLQIVKALLTLVLQDSNSRGLSIHQSALLKAVRTVYNIFLLSKSPTNQMIAQGALNQIVASVFNRVRPDPKLASSMFSSVSSPRPSMSRSNLRQGFTADDHTEGHTHANGDIQNGATISSPPSSGPPQSEKEADTPFSDGSRPSTDTVRPAAEEEEAEDQIAQTSGQTDSHPENVTSTEPATPTIKVEGAEANDNDDTQVPSREEQLRPTLANLPSVSAEAVGDGLRTPLQEAAQPFFSLNELHTKDAYLVFRALCKLGMKPLGVESERDMKSHAMRSKLLSLHLILSILHNNTHLFNDPNVVIYSANTKEFQTLLQAVKQYLLLCLSRNAVSSVLSVFELSCEIFWRCIYGLRTKLKKEIEVLLNEIFLPILEMRNSSLRQKAVLLSIFGRLSLDPQALVELYINYDCDRTSLDNIYERLVNIISRISTTQFTTVTPPYHAKEGKEGKELDSNAASSASWTAVMPFLPTIPGTAPSAAAEVTVPYFGQPLTNSSHTVETQLRRQSLDCLVSVLHSLVAWAGRPSAGVAPALPASTSSVGLAESGMESPALGGTTRNSEDEGDRSADLSREHIASANGSTPSLPHLETFDDPGRFETAKMRKTTLLEGFKKFNYKPKRGIQFLIENGFIKSKQPKDVAAFLLSASDGLSKAMIGEYLGEADPDNVATMHAFVDFMNFQDLKFTDALRTFLQAFRLPGEAQKIDRYMLKYAERYIACNPGVFADADTAYILAFAAIMLNTDAHSPQIKRNRMTKAEFIKNNRGINNGQDLPEELLTSIYDEIVSNEIKMKDEVDPNAGMATPTTGLAGALSIVGRDLQREAYLAQSEGMANKTEAMFKTMVRSQRRGTQKAAGDIFFSAHAVEHVRPMFEVVWMPLLAGISHPLQDSEDGEVIDRSLDGFRQAIKIVCLFDLELERNAFVSTLHKYTLLNDFSAMRPKNVEAIRCLLDVAAINGNYLKTSWKEVIVCVSQLERFQLITRGVDSGAVPEIGRRHSTITSTRANANKPKSGRPTEEVAIETLSAHITNAADRIFSSSSTLSGTAIVDFVRALSEVSWEEIQSSGLAEHPRVFCLQKLVEIAYYNMNRIRLEWSHMWAILGEHFNQVCCHTNANVSFLALDSLRQLAMRFLEKQELPNFNFQKDFLRPFEYAMIHNKNPDARDMILSCMQQMIQARVYNLRSGWRTMFSVFCAASRVQTERVAIQAFDIVKQLNKLHFALIVTYGSFADLAVCITDFCKISKYQKISLHAIEMLRALIPQMLQSPECPITADGPPAKSENDTSADDPMTRYWFPVLFGFYDIIMNGEDLEVRKRALDYLFDTLREHGHSFPSEFWDSVCKEVLFPIFAVLRSRSDVSRLSTHEEMSVWFSTTMIQALRDLVDLFTYYFDVLLRMLDQLLALLVECICQENDTLARIGTSCLQQLLEKNVHKLTPELWEKTVTTFVQLFQTTTAAQLFDENLRQPIDPDAPESPAETPQANPNGFIHPTPLPDTSTPSSHDPSRATRALGFSERRRIFRQIIVKCVLQLLLIETAHDLLQNEEVYATIPPADLLRLMAELDHSYRFAKRFNADKELRLALWKVGFMKQLPNLLKQESSSAATLVNVLLRMQSDTRSDHIAKRQETINAFLPLGIDILEGYVGLDGETQARNISAWTPVVAEVLQGFCSWEDSVLQEHVAVIYPLAIDLMARDMAPEIRESVRSVFHRVGLALKIFQAEESVNDNDEEEEGTEP